MDSTQALLLPLHCCLLLLLLPGVAAGGLDASAEQNVTVNWDFLAYRDDGYNIRVSICNYQLYRHVESPGWKLGWTWPGEEVIWDMRGAEATEQGNCSRINAATSPHCCEQSPLIIDLLPNAPYNFQAVNCCRGGVLSSMAQDPSKNMVAFEMSVGIAVNLSNPEIKMPSDVSLGLPGYTCSNFSNIKPSKYLSADGRRYTQSLATWQATCTYSQFMESVAPSCCVSLSSFYSKDVVACPACSCGCQGEPGVRQCTVDGSQPQLTQLLQNDIQQSDTPPSVLRCTSHMCPIHVHWHVKLSYKEYWRVKVTINNLNFVRNYSDWTLVIQHPNFESINQVFSFNYKPLLYGKNGPNDTGVFWGIDHYNDMLLQYGENGNVQTELLLDKDPEMFTFSGGWAFPRRVLFNGHDCVMPAPDNYPMLPNRSPAAVLPGIHVMLALLAPLAVFNLFQFL